MVVPGARRSKLAPLFPPLEMLSSSLDRLTDVTFDAQAGELMPLLKPLFPEAAATKKPLFATMLTAFARLSSSQVPACWMLSPRLVVMIEMLKIVALLRHQSSPAMTLEELVVPEVPGNTFTATNFTPGAIPR